MDLGTAFFLGFVGSFHCAGMCGPLVLALPGGGQGPATFLLGRLAYNVGRLFTYAALGLVFGFVGKSLTVVGLQQWISIAAGLVILIATFTARWIRWSGPIDVAVPWLKKQLAARMNNRTFPSLAVLGALNGLLPCGLVYVACAAASSTGGAISSVVYMVLFGLGTVPMMLGASILGRNVQASIRLRFQRMIPFALVVVGLMLVLRGLALGIPILSPNLANSHRSGDSLPQTHSSETPKVLPRH